MRCLSLDREQRPRDATTLIALFEAAHASHAAPPPLPSVRPPPASTARSRYDAPQEAAPERVSAPEVASRREEQPVTARMPSLPGTSPPHAPGWRHLGLVAGGTAVLALLGVVYGRGDSTGNDDSMALPGELPTVVPVDASERDAAVQRTASSSSAPVRPNDAGRVNLGAEKAAQTYLNAGLQDYKDAHLTGAAQMYEAGLEVLRNVQVSPDLPHTLHDNLAYVRFDQGRVSEALAHWNEALFFKAEADAYAGRALALDALGRRAEALASLRGAVERDPGYLDAEWRVRYHFWSAVATKAAEPLVKAFHAARDAGHAPRR